MNLNDYLFWPLQLTGGLPGCLSTSRLPSPRCPPSSPRDPEKDSHLKNDSAP